jgi:hypothetical protein
MKKLLTAGMTVLTVLIVTGCVGTKALGVLDESVPRESLCPLEIRNNISVIVYDNRPVEWIPRGLTTSRVTISLPPGEHTFMARYYSGDGNTVFTEKITGTFLPGHSYRIYRRDIWLLLFTISDVKLKDVTPKDRRLA